MYNKSHSQQQEQNMNNEKMKSFTDAYIACALWSSTDDNDEPMDNNYCHNDIEGGALMRMAGDCAIFLKNNEHLIEDCSQAGHDFWLTRNGHGTGFWDRGLGAVGEQLTNAAQEFGEANLFVSDDGTILFDI